MWEGYRRTLDCQVRPDQANGQSINATIGLRIRWRSVGRKQTNKKLGIPLGPMRRGWKWPCGAVDGPIGSVCFVLPHQSRVEVDLGALLEMLLARRRIQWPHKIRPW